MLFQTSNIVKIDGPVTFLLYELESFFWIDVHTQLILEFKNSFGKNCLVFQKFIKTFFFLGAFLDKQFCKN